MTRRSRRTHISALWATLVASVATMNTIVSTQKISGDLPILDLPVCCQVLELLSGVFPECFSADREPVYGAKFPRQGRRSRQML